MKFNRTTKRITKQHFENLPINYVKYLLLTSIVYHTYTYLSILFSKFLKSKKDEQNNKISQFKQRKIVKFVGWLELFLYYQDNRDLGGCAPQTPQKREVYTAPRRPHGPPRGGGFTLLYAQYRHLAQHPQHKLVSMLNRPDSQKYINCRSNHVKRHKEI